MHAYPHGSLKNLYKQLAGGNLRILHILMLVVFSLLILAGALFGHDMFFPETPIQSVMGIVIAVFAGFFMLYLWRNRARHRVEFPRASRRLHWVTYAAMGAVLFGFAGLLMISAWRGSVVAWYFLAIFYAFAFNPVCREGRSFLRTRVFALRFGVALVATACLLGAILLR